MGLKDLFSAAGRAERSRQKNIARVRDKHAQSVDRFEALEALEEDGTPAAIVGMLGRFSMRYDKTIEDEQEKQWVYDRLKRRGATILPSLRTYLLATDTLSFALRLLGEIGEIETIRPLIDELLQKHDNTYTRDPEPKTQLLHFLGDLKDEKLARALVAYLDDVDEGVRYTAVESLLKQGLAAVAFEPLLKHLQNPSEESRRLKRRILEGIGEQGWEIPKPEIDTVQKLVADLWSEARIDNHGRIKKGK